MPRHSSPVQALDHACTQASRAGCSGNEKIAPSRIWSIDLSEVATITYSGSRKKAALISRKP